MPEAAGIFEVELVDSLDQAFRRLGRGNATPTRHVGGDQPRVQECDSDTFWLEIMPKVHAHHVDRDFRDTITVVVARARGWPTLPTLMMAFSSEVIE